MVADNIKNINSKSLFPGEISKSVFSILLLLMVFFVLISSVAGFSVYLIFFGINLFFKKYLLFTIPFGIIVTITAIMQLVFIANFLSKNKSKSTFDLFEIDEINYPELFNLIKSVAKESKVKFPKKVYLSPDANAYVFSQPSIWHLFFPPHRNLCIGFGLLNILNQSELKCILAHEFGHFKQNSINIESYVKRVNQVIFNLLFGQEKLDKLRTILPKIFPTFVYYMEYGNFMISLVEDILKWLFIKINTHHFSLRRSLEFDADRFSSRVFGSENMIQALTMMKFGVLALDEVIRCYDPKSNTKTHNIYLQQTSLFNNNLEKHKLSGDVTRFRNLLDFNDGYPYSRIKIDTIFDTHPATMDRIAYLKELDFPTKRKEGLPAIYLLPKVSSLQEYFTNKIFDEMGMAAAEISISLDDFEEKYREFESSTSFGEPFGSFYTYYSPDFDKLDSVSDHTKSLDILSLFSGENQEKSFEFAVLKEDLAVLEKIERGEALTDFFEFEGLKYYKDQTKSIEKEVSSRIDNIVSDFSEIDLKVLTFFNDLSDKHKVKSVFLSKVKNYNQSKIEVTQNQIVLKEMVEAVGFFSKDAPPDIILIKLRKFKKVEKIFKKALKSTVESFEKEEVVSNENLIHLQKYLKSEQVYFKGIRFHEEDIKLLHQVLIDFENVALLRFLHYKRKVLEFFSELYSKDKN